MEIISQKIVVFIEIKQSITGQEKTTAPHKHRLRGGKNLKDPVVTSEAAVYICIQTLMIIEALLLAR